MPKRKKRSQTHTRAWILLFTFIIIGFGTAIFSVFYVSIVEGQQYNAMALQQSSSRVTKTATRGSIQDRNGQVLANSLIVWNVIASPKDAVDDKENTANFNKIITDLADILEMDSQTVEKAVNATGESGNLLAYSRVKMKVTNAVKEEIEAYLGTGKDRISWIYFEQNTKRNYTFDTLASTLIGFTDGEGNGAYGLEAYYNSVLSGTPGVSVANRDAWGAAMPNNDGYSFEAQDGNSIILTLDQTVQTALEKHLRMAVEEHNVQNKAAGIVYNMKTGEILAMASIGDYNLNDPYALPESVLEDLEEENLSNEEYQKALDDARFSQWRNKAVSDPYEPGSVFKIITASMALEDQLTFENDSFYCQGYYEVAGEKINCWNTAGHGAEDLVAGMRNSCNPVFMQLGLRSGAKRMYNILQNYGYGQITGVDLPGEAEGILHSYDRLNMPGGFDLAETSFGQSFKATPLQVIASVSASVNDGYLMQPFVVKQIVDSNNNVLETTQPEVKRQVVSQETSDIIKDLVEQVVANGSGRQAAIPGYRIGGKTGTSEKLDLLPEKKYVLSFVGFAPMEDPTYACLVILDEPIVSNPLGSVIAAPIVGSVFQEILPYLGVEPSYSDEQLAQGATISVPGVVGLKPHDAQAELTTLGLKTTIVGEGSQVVTQIPQSGVKVVPGSTVTLYTQKDRLKEEIVPDFYGYTKEQAQQKINSLNLNVSFEGSTGVDTAVGMQWPTPDTTVQTGDVIVLTMIPSSQIETDGDRGDTTGKPPASSSSSTPSAQDDTSTAGDEGTTTIIVPEDDNDSGGTGTDAMFVTPDM